MLKIKDDVDLKELEKFGFKPRYDEYTGEINAYEKRQVKNEWLGISIKPASIKTKIRIFKKTTKIWGINPYNDYFDIDTLFDLIKAGLVEKVGD